MGMLLHKHLVKRGAKTPAPKKEVEKVVEKEVKTRRRNDKGGKDSNN